MAVFEQNNQIQHQDETLWVLPLFEMYFRNEKQDATRLRRNPLPLEFIPLFNIPKTKDSLYGLIISLLSKGLWIGGQHSTFRLSFG